MWYITTDIDSCIKNGGLGGLGHMYFNYITSYIIGIIFDIEHMYYPFDAAGSSKHSTEKRSEIIDWDEFFNFSESETDYMTSEINKINLPILKPFKSYELSELRTFFANYDRDEDIIFVVNDSNRIYINEFYEWCEKGILDMDLYNKLLITMRNKCIYQPNINKGTVVCQIRRGDVCRTPLSYYKNVLDKIMLTNDINKVVILSLGTQKQMKPIMNFFKFLDIEVEYKLNYDTIESFKIMMDAEILICGESSFPKIAGLYSDNIKYFIPLCDNGKLGRSIEHYGNGWFLVNLKGEIIK